MADKVSGGSTLNINCKRTTKKKIQAIMCQAAKTGGEPAFEAYKTAHNAFVSQLSGMANSIVAVVEPILTIDKFVIETFVRPPLDATVKILEETTKTIKVPLRIIGSLDSTGQCAKFHTGLRKTTDSCVAFLTRDFTKISNIADELEEWVGDRTQLIEDLHALADTVSDLSIDQDFQEFITTICPTISQ